MFGILPSPCKYCDGAVTSLYTAYFCGLSSTLAAEYGVAFRFLTNRDATFMALVGGAVSGAPATLSERRCCNPIGKRRAMVLDTSPIRMSAAACIAGVSAKLRDTTDDSRGIAKPLSQLGESLLASTNRKAELYLSQMGVPVKEIRGLFLEQQARENAYSGVKDFSLVSEPTSFAYGALFAGMQSEQSSLKRELFDLGVSFGRLTYFVDALVDRQRDLLRGHFNPFVREGESEVYVDLGQTILDRFRGSLHRLTKNTKHSELLSSVTSKSLERHLKKRTGFSFFCSSEESREVQENKESKKRHRAKKNNKSDCCSDCAYCCDCSTCCEPACCRPSCRSGGGASDCCSFHCCEGLVACDCCCPCDGC